MCPSPLAFPARLKIIAFYLPVGGGVHTVTEEGGGKYKMEKKNKRFRPAAFGHPTFPSSSREHIRKFFFV